MVAKEDDGNGASAIVATTVAQGQIPRGSDDSSHPVVLVRQMEHEEGEGENPTLQKLPKSVVKSVYSIARNIGLSPRLQCCEFRLENPCPVEDEYEKYRHSHPLVYSLLKEEGKRRRRLTMEGAKQMNHYPSKNSWFNTLTVWEGRAMGHILVPWCIVVGHAVLYTCLQELVLKKNKRWNHVTENELGSWETFFGVALNATLSLLLVFRLNRAAARWWLARQSFGILMAKARNLMCGLVLAKHNPVARDDAIRWLAAYAICTMEFLRGCPELHDDLFAGVLSPSEKAEVQRMFHPPLYAGHQIRHSISRVYSVTADIPFSLATSYSQQEAILIQEWTGLLDQCGAMERIKATPLPIVYVSHLRTFLLVALLLYPYVWGYDWRWSTIPIAALAAFGMLGIESASIEVEQPFRKDRINALNMDGFW